VDELIATLSNTPHLHLILNHVPTVGFGIALGLLIAGWARQSDDLKRASLVLLFGVAVVSIATYVTGSAAASTLGSSVVRRVVHAHEDAALLAFVCMQVTGFFAWLALWRWRRVRRLGNGYFSTVLIFSIVTFGLMARAAELGGAIHHPEILADAALQTSDSAAAHPGTPGSDASTPSPSDAGWARSFGDQFVVGRDATWPALETLHFVGLCMLFMVVLIVNLRMLGMFKSLSYAAFDQLLPLGMLGFGLNLITGMMFFIGRPEQYVHNRVFYWKIVFILLGGLNVIYFMLDEKVWNVKAGDDAARGPKIAAASSMLIWAAVLFCGHMLPFLGNAF